MNVKALQQADPWLGLPLCIGLTALRRLARPFARKRPAPLRRLLFVKLAEQGSTVLAYPAIRRAQEMVGKKNVYFITFEDNRFILDALQTIPAENVITVSVRSGRTFLSSALLAIRHLRRLELDAAIDLEFFSRGSAALTYMSGAPARVGFHPFFGAGPYRGNLMTHRMLYNPHLHTSETFLTLVEALARDPADLPTLNVSLRRPLADPLPFEPREDECRDVIGIVRREAGCLPPLVLLNPNTGDLLPLRKWPVHRYVDLARRLLARYPELFVAFTGAADEAAAAADLVRQVGSERCFSLAGKTTLRQLLVLYTLAEVLVTNDSGPAHFATLTSIRVVTLFGPEAPSLFAARTPRNTVLWAQLPCSPCVSAYNNRQSTCTDNLCMQSIQVEQVYANVCRAYEQARAQNPQAAAV